MSDDKNKTKYNKITPRPVEAVQREEDIQPEARKVKKVIDYEVKEHKRTFGERMKGAIFSEDGAKSILGYLGRDVVVPAVKNIIVDAISSGINMAVFGDKGTRKAGAYRGPVNRTGYVNYANRYSPSNYNTPSSNRDEGVRSSNRVGEYPLRTRAQAREVLDILIENAAHYGVATVADYYDAIGVDTTFTDNAYGWSEDDLIHATLTTVRDGVVITLPRPIQVN